MASNVLVCHTTVRKFFLLDPLNVFVSEKQNLLRQSCFRNILRNHIRYLVHTVRTVVPVPKMNHNYS